MKTFFVIPDMQVPYHDDGFLNALYQIIEDSKPDEILIVGDELDAPEPSRWSRGYASEYARTLQKSINQCHNILANFRESLGDGAIHLMRSNHGERIQKYVSKYAPALASLESLEYQQLLRLDDIGVTYHDKPYEFANGFVLAHGDEGSQARYASGTALNLAKKWNKSVVCGHTHKAGMAHHHSYLNNKASSLLYGVEVGHAMSMRKAGYLSAGSADWQQAFAVIRAEGKTVIPELIYERDRRLFFNGMVYKW